MKLKKAILDVETRWGSKYDMLNRLLELKPTCLDLADTFKELKLSNIEWTSIEKMVNFYLISKIVFFLTSKQI